MRILIWVLRGFLFLVLFGFAIKNTEQVAVHFFLDMVWQAPLVIVVFVFFVSGILLGALSLLGTIFKLRREQSGLRRELKQMRAIEANPSRSQLS